MYVYIYIYVYTHVHIYIDVHMYMYIYIYICIDVSARACVRVCVCVSVALHDDSSDPGLGRASGRHRDRVPALSGLQGTYRMGLLVDIMYITYVRKYTLVLVVVGLFTRDPDDKASFDVCQVQVFGHWTWPCCRVTWGGLPQGLKRRASLYRVGPGCVNACRLDD